MTDVTNYIFGYGSLIDQTSRTRTNPNAHTATPVMVEGLARGWWIHGDPIGFSTCFLAVQSKPYALCNGVIYSVTPNELDALDVREANYTRVRISPEQVERLDGSAEIDTDARYWAYTVSSQQRTTPTARYPIVQSYVDICLTGCLDIEDTYPQARAAGFSKLFITSTQDWNTHWVNDRIHPRRPFIHVPQARQIDRLLHDNLPDLFNQIQLEPRRDD